MTYFDFNFFHIFRTPFFYKKKAKNLNKFFAKKFAKNGKSTFVSMLLCVLLIVKVGRSLLQYTHWPTDVAVTFPQKSNFLPNN